MRVLVTGGTGFIGSHTSVALVEAGHEVVILDNLSRSSAAVAEAVGAICKREITRVRADVRASAALEQILAQYRIEAVLHFAALRDVEASLRGPLACFDNNVAGTLSLLQAMRATAVQRLVFSSTAAVYGDTDAASLAETQPALARTPYGRSKWMCEQMIADVTNADPSIRAVILRYFNPVGAHASGLIGESPCGQPGNLFTRLGEVACGQRPWLAVFGCDYPTPDGTGIRDYLHVMDVAEAHVRALQHLAAGGAGITLNLGSGRGCSVLEVAKAFEHCCGRTIPLRFMARREGDVARSCADPNQAEAVLGWRAQRSLERMCEDAWRWQQRRGQA